MDTPCGPRCTASASAPDRAFGRGAQAMSFSRTKVEGTLPPLISLPSLTALDLSNTEMSGSIPDSAGAGMPKVKYLELSRSK